MNILNFFKKKTKGAAIPGSVQSLFEPAGVLPMAQLAKDKKNVYQSLQLRRINAPRVELEMSKFKAALVMARSVDNPDRRLLLAFYDELTKDAHLTSQLRTAIYTVTQSKFQIQNQSETPQPELHKLFETTWFLKLLEMLCDAEFYGHSLIEFHTENSEIKDVVLIPRNHVCPELGYIAITPGDHKGITYRDALYDLDLLETNDFLNLGLLEIAAREVIWKNYSRSDWSRASEKFGMPLLAIKTNASSEKEVDKMQDMAENFGSNGYVIIDKNDDVTMNTISSGDTFYKSYLELSNLCDTNISKLINGQTMTADNGSSYAQANVHERILNNYTRARVQKIQNWINDTLFPYMTNVGYKLADNKFVFQDIIDWYADKPEQTEIQMPKALKKKLNTINQLYR